MLARLMQSFARWSTGKGRTRFLAGHDLAGNTYYEYPAHNEGGQLPSSNNARGRRVVRYREHKSIEDYNSAELPVQWKMWLRHTRRSAPTLEELRRDQQRMIELDAMVQNITRKDLEMREREQAKKLEEQAHRDALDAPQSTESRQDDSSFHTLGQAPDQSASQAEALKRAPDAARRTMETQSSAPSKASSPRPRVRTPVGAFTSEVADEGVVESRTRRVPISVQRSTTDAQTAQGQRMAGHVAEERTADQEVWQASKRRVEQQEHGRPVDSSGGRRSYSSWAIAAPKSMRRYSTGPVRPTATKRQNVSPAAQETEQNGGQSTPKSAKADIPLPVYAAGAAAVGLALAALWTVPDPWKLKKGESATKIGDGIAADRWTPLKLLASHFAVSGTGEDPSVAGDGRHKILRLQSPETTKSAAATTTTTTPQRPAIWSVSVMQPDIQIERSYTPLYPPEEASSRGSLELLVKRYENGEMGRYLHSLIPGQDSVEVRGWLPTWQARGDADLEEIVLVR